MKYNSAQFASVLGFSNFVHPKSFIQSKQLEILVSIIWFISSIYTKFYSVLRYTINKRIYYILSAPTVWFLKIALMTVDAHFYSIFVAKSISKDRASNYVPISLINTLIKMIYRGLKIKYRKSWKIVRVSSRDFWRKHQNFFFFKKCLEYIAKIILSNIHLETLVQTAFFLIE